MPVLAPLIIGGATLAGGLISANAAKSASNAQVAEEQQGLQLQQGQLAKLQPWIDTGSAANTQLGALYGIGNGGTPNFSGFTNSPDYQFAQQQGNNALQNYFNANGLAGSGGALTAASQYNQGLATQQFGNYFNRLMSLSQLGAQTAGTGVNGANAAANTFGSIGQSQASGIVGGANAITSGINSSISNSLLYNAINKNGGFNFGSPSSSPSSYANSSFPSFPSVTSMSSLGG